MNNSVKAKQLKYVFVALGGIGLLFLIFLAFKGEASTKNLKSERHYKKEISTGVDGLSPQEMWIENSTNELNEMRKQNKDLQEQLDKVQKVVIGMGRAMNVFDDQISKFKNSRG
jgi:peptidoglycan hydrolase CwlO-like protein